MAHRSSIRIKRGLLAFGRISIFAHENDKCIRKGYRTERLNSIAAGIGEQAEKLPPRDAVQRAAMQCTVAEHLALWVETYRMPEPKV